MTLILSALLGYILGSIPFGLVFTKAAGLGDIREVGSGNIGATNVLRTGRKDLAAATLVLDSGKGAIAVLIAYALGWRPEIAGRRGVSGPLLSRLAEIQGRQSVATFLGTLLALWFPAGLMTCATWLGAAYLTRYSSLSALLAAAAAPLILFSMGASLCFGGALHDALDPDPS